MTTFLGSIWWMIVTLGLLVTFHEFGHFWVARRCGVRVLRFSVGFGKPLWRYRARSGTEYWIAMIPLGGYVKMLDAREEDVPASELADEFSSQPLWKRVAIVIAGPAFNLLFAVAAFWLMFTIGKPDFAPVIGTPHGLAAEAGFQAGERILAVDGTKVTTWTGVLDELSTSLLVRQPVSMTTRDADGVRHQRQLALDTLPADADMGRVLGQVGLRLQPPPARVARVVDGSPAAAAGLEPGDLILAINDTKVHSFAELGQAIGSQAARDPRLEMRLRRDGHVETVLVHARKHANERGPPRWTVGVVAAPPERATLQYGPVAAMGAALAETWEKTAMTFEMIGSMLTGQASAQNLSGVITIARMANTTANMGLAWFLGFLALISLSLAILNILPIPLLDGGHLLYYLIELVKGSPVSENTMIIGQYVGLTLLAALMGLAFYNDILRLVS